MRLEKIDYGTIRVVKSIINQKNWTYISEFTNDYDNSCRLEYLYGNSKDKILVFTYQPDSEYFNIRCLYIDNSRRRYCDKITLDLEFWSIPIITKKFENGINECLDLFERLLKTYKTKEEKWKNMIS